MAINGLFHEMPLVFVLGCSIKETTWTHLCLSEVNTVRQALHVMTQTKLRLDNVMAIKKKNVF